MTDPEPDPVAGLPRLVLLALAGGAVTGVVGGLFRRLLAHAEVLRDDLLGWAGDGASARVLVPVVVCAAAVAAARHLVRRVPEAAGSGVQRVEAYLRAEIPPAPTAVLPVKFVGGLLSLGSGMVLGREGPTVQMGATVGDVLSRRTRLPQDDARTLSVSLAGAGLGVAFSAPLGGAMFALEEVSHAFRPRLVVATLAGTASALVVTRWIVGPEAVLPVGPVEAGPAVVLLAYAVLGLVLGALGVAYNRVVVRMLDLAGRWPAVPPEAKAAAVAVVVVAIGLAAPWLIGGGDVVNEDVLVGSPAVHTLVLVVLVRWLLGPLCYSVGTPGGLFAPLLVLGAAAGSLFAAGVADHLPGPTVPAASFAVVGMTAFFTAVVRAPVTGVVLLMEMTAQTTLVLPMVVGALAALVAATLLHGPPVYDTLRTRMETTERGTSR